MRTPSTATSASPISVRSASRAERRSPTLASATEPSAARSTCTLPFFAVTTASAPVPGAPVDAAETAARSPLQAGTATSRARSAAGRIISGLYEGRGAGSKLSRGSRCAVFLQQPQLPAPARPAKGLRLALTVEPLVHPEALHRRVEERACSFCVRTLTAAAHAEARIVELAAARVAHAVQDAVRPQRQRLAHALFEHLLHRPGQAEEDEARAPGAGGVRRFEDPRDVRIGETGDHRRDVHADGEAGGGEPLDRLHAPLRCRDVRLDRVRVRAIPDRDADADGHARLAVKLLQEVDVALDQRRLGDQPDGIAVLGADLEASARQAVARLE